MAGMCANTTTFQLAVEVIQSKRHSARQIADVTGPTLAFSTLCVQCFLERLEVAHPFDRVCVVHHVYLKGLLYL